MEPGEWALQALDMIESEIRAVVHSETPLAPKSETDMELASLIQKIGATSIVEIEKIIGALQEAKDFLFASIESGSTWTVRKVYVCRLRGLPYARTS